MKRILCVAICLALPLASSLAAPLPQPGLKSKLVSGIKKITGIGSSRSRQFEQGESSASRGALEHDSSSEEHFAPRSPEPEPRPPSPGSDPYSYLPQDRPWPYVAPHQREVEAYGFPYVGDAVIMPEFPNGGQPIWPPRENQNPLHGYTVTGLWQDRNGSKSALFRGPKIQSVWAVH